MQGVVNGLDLTQVLENLNFLNIDNMWTLINGKLKPLIWRSNVKHKSYLVFSTYIKIMELESHYCIGRELWSVYPTGCHQIWPGGASCQQTGQTWGRITLSCACLGRGNICVQYFVSPLNNPWGVNDILLMSPQREKITVDLREKCFYQVVSILNKLVINFEYFV